MFASTLELRNALFSFTSVLHQLIKSDLRIYDRKSGVRMFKKTERLKKSCVKDALISLYLIIYVHGCLGCQLWVQPYLYQFSPFLF